MFMQKRLLIVDDQSGIRLLLKDIFSVEGYHITEAINGKEALERVNTETFDIVLLDYHLPLLSGQQVLAEMRRLKLLIPVILMSGSAELLLKIAFKDSDNVHIIPKPFNITDIRQLVNSMVGV